MSVLNRISTILRANINDLLDRAEDPENEPRVRPEDRKKDGLPRPGMARGDHRAYDDEDPGRDAEGREEPAARGMGPRRRPLPPPSASRADVETVRA